MGYNGANALNFEGTVEECGPKCPLANKIEENKKPR